MRNSRSLMKFMAYLLCFAMTAAFFTGAAPVLAETSGDGSPKEESGGTQDDSAVDLTGINPGAAQDVSLSDISVTRSSSGKTVNVSFTASGSSGSGYTVNRLTRVCPVIDDSFPFETDNEAYRVSRGSGDTVHVSYTFNTKKNMAAGYYPLSFAVLYNKSDSQNTEFYVTKQISVDLKSTEQTSSDPQAAEGDVTLKVPSVPSGTYSGPCTVSFRLKAKGCSLVSVSPQVTDNFPFEAAGEAYQTKKLTGTSASVSYKFKVRSDVNTGYSPVTFDVKYKKGKKTLSTQKTVYVKLTGKSSGDGGTSGTEVASSNPRLMVSGYDSSVKDIHPGDDFRLNLHMRNTAKQTVSNIKITLTSDGNDFIPVSGANSQFVESIPADTTKDVIFELKAGAGLTTSVYTVGVHSSYEDSRSDAFDVDDSIAIPVTQVASASITDIVPPDGLAVDTPADMTFTVNNTGACDLTDCRVIASGDGISCEEQNLGKITAGSQGYATLSLTGTSEEDESDVTITVTYKDPAGRDQTLTADTTVSVLKDAPVTDDMSDEDQAPAKRGVPFWIWVIAAVVIAVIVIFIIRHRRKKRLAREEEELMDDEIS